MTATPVLAAAGLTAGYDGVAAVRGIDLDVHAGEIVCLLGPNGAGKSTTLLALAGVIAPMSGSVQILGARVSRAAPHRIARLGVTLIPEDRGLFRRLTVAENLRLRGQHGVGHAYDHFPALQPLAGRRAGLLSGGEQQMLALACALAARPKVLLIDELSHGLAPVVVQRLLPALRELATQGVGILLVEQQVHAALDVADRVCILSRGEVRSRGTSSEVRQRPEVLEALYFGEPASALDGPAAVADLGANSAVGPVR